MRVRGDVRVCKLSPLFFFYRSETLHAKDSERSETQKFLLKKAAKRKHTRSDSGGKLFSFLCTLCMPAGTSACRPVQQTVALEHALVRCATASFAGIDLQLSACASSVSSTTDSDKSSLVLT